jgi:peptide deformylase
VSGLHAVIVQATTTVIVATEQPVPEELPGHMMQLIKNMLGHMMQMLNQWPPFVIDSESFGIGHVPHHDVDHNNGHVWPDEVPKQL